MMMMVVVGGDAIYSQDGLRSGVVVRARKREKSKMPRQQRGGKSTVPESGNVREHAACCCCCFLLLQVSCGSRLSRAVGCTS